MASFSSLAIFVFLYTNCVLAIPAKDGAKLPAENLKLTFANSDDVPRAFFEPPTNRDERRIEYPACQDGSGGLCVGLGKCPSGYKVETTNALACKTRQECCYRVPDDEKSCQARGGQCTPSKSCGKAPTITEATDCNVQNGEVCCIYLN